MAVPLLIGLGKALLSQAPRVAAKQLGKKAVKNAAKNFIKGKKDKKKKKGGALVRSEDITNTRQQVKETVQKISPQKLLPSSVDTTTSPAVVSSSGKTSYEKISQRLDNIIGITGALDKAFKQQLKDKKKTAKAVQKRRQTESKKAREEKLEQGKKALGIGAAAMSAANKLGLMNFITNVLLGGLVLFLLKQAPKIEKIFNFLTENLYASFLIIRGVLQAFKGAFKQFGKIVEGILKTGVRFATKPFRMAGSAIASGFRRLGNAIFNFARMGLNLIRRGLGLKPIPKPPDKGGGKEKTKVTPTGSGAGKASRPAGFVPRSDARGNQVAGKGRQYRQNLTRTQVSATTTPSRLSRTAALRANLQTGTAFGGRGANLQRGAYGAVIKGNNFLRKLFNIVNPKEIQALADASPALKKAGNFMKGARIPVVGPLIVFTVNALDPTQSLGQAAFKAIGAGLGEFLGFAIPIPILGPILGGLVGEVMGDVAYSLIINKNPKEAGQKIMNAVKGVTDIGGKILEWAKGFVGRFFDALPKIKMPSVKVFGKETIPFGGTEIIDPTAILRPRALIEIPKAFLTALFQPEKKEEGKVKEVQEDKVSSSVDTSTFAPSNNATASVMSMSSGGMRDVVPQVNLQTIGGGSGPIGRSSERGMRGGRHHAGIDIGTSGQKGWMVAFKLKGTVDLVQSLPGYGKTVIINVGDYDFLFAHLANYNVKKGEKYDGQIIGEIGNTGIGSGEHLHFEVRTKGGGSGTDVDPNPYVKYLVIGKAGDGSGVTTTKLSPADLKAKPSIASGLDKSASYEEGAEQTIVVPLPSQEQTPTMQPQQSSSVIRVGGSTKDVLNSYYKAQLLGFLYKQG